jgi:hypothetical protein
MKTFPNALLMLAKAPFAGAFVLPVSENALLKRRHGTFVGAT